jgi:hypothetical protein
MLLVYGTSRLVMNTTRYGLFAAMCLRSLRPGSPIGTARHEPIEPTLQIGEMLCQGRVFQRVSSSSDCDRTQQQTGNDTFAWFATTGIKSHLSFLGLLRAGHTDFVLNDTTFDYMRTNALPATVIAGLAALPERVFANQPAWSSRYSA